MMHKPIQLSNISLSFPHKTCFEDFNINIQYGSRIAIIGRNGSGKSELLNILRKITQSDVTIGYVQQIIEDFDTMSGAQRFNKILTAALSFNPNVLLLDEPTNHLDKHNRKSLMRMLRTYLGTLIIISHDIELLRSCVDTLWHINDGKVHVFSGNYDDYMHEIHIKYNATAEKLSQLQFKTKSTHQALMKEQVRASKSRAKGIKSIAQRKWPTIVSHAKVLRAQETSGPKTADIEHTKQILNEQLSNLRMPEVITPKFLLDASDISDRVLMCISEGTVGYKDLAPLLQNINLSIASTDRISITGNNGSGKSTLIKAILNDPGIVKSGSWYVLNIQDIGYLDQHYLTLDLRISVTENIQKLVPSWSYTKIRSHLNDFLFRKNEEVNAIVSTLSGGERARLSLDPLRKC